jgi:hypothetical protein
MFHFDLLGFESIRSWVGTKLNIHITMLLHSLFNCIIKDNLKFFYNYSPFLIFGLPRFWAWYSLWYTFLQTWICMSKWWFKQFTIRFLLFFPNVFNVLYSKLWTLYILEPSYVKANWRTTPSTDKCTKELSDIKILDQSS